MNKLKPPDHQATDLSSRQHIAEAKNESSGINFSRHRRSMLTGCALTAAAAGLGLWSWQNDDAMRNGRQLKPGSNDIWAFEALLPNGQNYQMRHLKGKPVLVNFWATWCPPCIEELPLLDGFYRQNSEKGWQLVAIAADRLVSVQQFLAKTPLHFPTPVAGGEAIELSRGMGNATGALPFSLVFNSQAQITHRVSGVWNEKMLKDLKNNVF